MAIDESGEGVVEAEILKSEGFLEAIKYVCSSLHKWEKPKIDAAWIISNMAVNPSNATFMMKSDTEFYQELVEQIE